MITCLHHKAPGDEKNRALLVMLPGAGIEAADFYAHGMVAQAQDGDVVADVIAAQPALDLYLDGGIAAALHREVVEPALAAGYARIWLLGISLGGMGALLYADAFERHVDGIFLIAPFLGTQGTLAELAKTGLTRWSPEGSAATDVEKRSLNWLQSFLGRGGASPRLVLGYGEADRFAPGHRLLAAQLPPNRVVTVPGGHHWQSWTALWPRMLEMSVFAAKLDDAGAG